MLKPNNNDVALIGQKVRMKKTRVKGLSACDKGARLRSTSLGGGADGGRNEGRDNV